jgi:hypothetical protein
MEFSLEPDAPDEASLIFADRLSINDEPQAPSEPGYAAQAHLDGEHWIDSFTPDFESIDWYEAHGCFNEEMGYDSGNPYLGSDCHQCHSPDARLVNLSRSQNLHQLKMTCQDCMLKKFQLEFHRKPPAARVKDDQRFGFWQIINRNRWSKGIELLDTERGYTYLPTDSDETPYLEDSALALKHEDAGPASSVHFNLLDGWCLIGHQDYGYDQIK